MLPHEIEKVNPRFLFVMFSCVALFIIDKTGVFLLINSLLLLSIDSHKKHTIMIEHEIE